MTEGYFDLPRTWQWVPVADAGRVQLGRQRSPQHHTGDHMRPYLRVANVFENRIDTRDVLEMNFTPAEAQRYLLEEGDILLNEGQSRELVGRPAMFRGEVPGACFQNTLVRFRPHEGVTTPEYALGVFRLYLRAGYFQNVCKWTTNIAHLGAERFAAMPFPLAPLPEQKRIADKLDALLARVDACRQRLDRVPAILKRFRQSILAAATGGELTREWREENRADLGDAENEVSIILDSRRNALAGQRFKEPPPPDTQETSIEVPKTWTLASVAAVAECLDSRRVPIKKDLRARTTGRYPYYGANGQVDMVDDYLFDDELVLVTEDETFYGRTKPIAYRSSGRCWVNNHAHVLRPKDAVWADYLCFSLMYRDVTPWLTGTTGRAKLTQAALNALPVAVPSSIERAEIVRRTRELLAIADLLERHTAAASRVVERVTPSTLAKAFRGKLVPQDPNDEDAAQLLERLGRGSAKAPTAKPARKRPRRKAS